MIRIPSVAYLLLFLSACGDKNNGSTDTFDRKALLQHFTSKIIRASYEQMRAQAALLEGAVQTFNGAPSATTLQNLQNAWTSAYTAWQYANAFNFGPAGEQGLRKGLIEEAGTFPANTPKMEAAISAGAWNRDARGFLAMEYLIFGQNQSLDAIVAQFGADANRRNYLLALAANANSRITDVLTAWNGDYANTFIQNAGTDAGSSISALYNEFVRSFEAIKNFKLGLPLGKRPGQTQAAPELCEALYSGRSVAMIKAHFAAIEAIWHGRALDGSDGPGFREYLESVQGGPELIAATETQIAAVKTAMNSWPDTPLQEQVTGNPAAAEAVYIELSKTTRYFKSDLSSLLGIAITFSSGDGD
jgi:uncharacterized protein